MQLDLTQRKMKGPNKMKRLLVLLFVVGLMLLSACSQKVNNKELTGVIKNENNWNEFDFTEEEFGEQYEKNTGKLAPASLDISYAMMSVEDVSAKQMEGFLQTAYDMLGDEDIKIMYKSFKEDREELVPDTDRWRKVKSGERMLIDYGITDEGSYQSLFMLNQDFDTE